MTYTRTERTPGALQRTEGSGTTSSTAKTTAGPAIYGRIRIDLRGLDDDEVRRRIRDLNFAPAGATVTVTVNRGQYPPAPDVELLVSEGPLGNVVIESDNVQTINDWMTIFRREDIHSVV